MPWLLAITPGDGRDLEPWLRALGAAGLPAVLLREPHADEATLRRWLHAADAHVPCVVLHDRHPLARTTGHPVHLPDDGRAPPDGPFTAAVHDAQGLDQRLGQGAAWVLLSPVWAPTSKPLGERGALGPARTLELGVGRAVLGLGGVGPERHRRLRQAGLAGTAVLGDLFGRPSPDAAAERLRAYSTGEVGGVEPTADEVASGSKTKSAS